MESANRQGPEQETYKKNAQYFSNTAGETEQFAIAIITGDLVLELKTFFFYFESVLRT